MGGRQQAGFSRDGVQAGPSRRGTCHPALACAPSCAPQLCHPAPALPRQPSPPGTMLSASEKPRHGSARYSAKSPLSQAGGGGATGGCGVRGRGGDALSASLLDNAGQARHVAGPRPSCCCTAQAAAVPLISTPAHPGRGRRRRALHPAGGEEGGGLEGGGVGKVGGAGGRGGRRADAGAGPRDEVAAGQGQGQGGRALGVVQGGASGQPGTQQWPSHHRCRAASCFSLASAGGPASPILLVAHQAAVLVEDGHTEGGRRGGHPCRTG